MEPRTFDWNAMPGVLQQAKRHSGKRGMLIAASLAVAVAIASLVLAAVSGTSGPKELDESVRLPLALSARNVVEAMALHTGGLTDIPGIGSILSDEPAVLAALEAAYDGMQWGADIVLADASGQTLGEAGRFTCEVRFESGGQAGMVRVTFACDDEGLWKIVSLTAAD